MGWKMDPRVLSYLANTEGMTKEEVLVNDTLIKMYLAGFVEARWEKGEPLFSISVDGDLLAYAYAQKPIEE